MDTVISEKYEFAYINAVYKKFCSSKTLMSEWKNKGWFSTYLRAVRIGHAEIQETRIAAGNIHTTVFDEARTIDEWNHSPSLRDEFGGNKATYLAFLKAQENGQVRIFQKKVVHS